MSIRNVRYAAALAVIVMSSAGAGSAYAHGLLQANKSLWAAWNLTPEITLGTVLFAGLYTAGLWHRRHKTDAVGIWRHVSFFAGLAAIFLALQSPIDPIAERVFLVHQVQHILLRLIGPMLLFLAAPQGLLIAGTPEWTQRAIVTPVLTNGAVRAVFGFLAHPVTVTALFIGTLYFWQLPKYHNMALLNDTMHYLMHVSMLLPGLLFFWRIFDPRPAPMGTRYGVRLMMLWIMILSNIVIGSYLAFKQPVLYPAYEELGRIWELSARGDELLGGALIWIPSSMMGVVAVLIVVNMWGRREEKVEAHRRLALNRKGLGRNEPPLMGADLVQAAAGKNRIMALSFAGFVIVVFATAIVLGIANRMMGS
jgi:putative membrane protein